MQELTLLKDIISDIWQKYGPFAALSILGIIWYDYSIKSLYSKIIKAKDDEIERLVEERNKLQDVIIKKRLTSEMKK
ncbi:MAG: hypothetical protein V1933_00310 [Candidatus Omnitrophota bacterium]